MTTLLIFFFFLLLRTKAFPIQDLRNVGLLSLAYFQWDSLLKVKHAHFTEYTRVYRNLFLYLSQTFELIALQLIALVLRQLIKMHYTLYTLV